MFMVVSMAKKTTILLRADVYLPLRARAGVRNISRLINKIIVDYFAKKESMFRIMKKVDISDLRDHSDRL